MLTTLFLATALAAAPDSAAVRPDHVNNALSPFFPAVFNQDGGSCGSASRIGYMFTHEMNAYRHTPATDDEHIYPTHFTWLLTNSHSSKDGMAVANGVPSAALYGGKTYSRLYGNQDCSAPDFAWMQGYDKWYAAMFNRITPATFSPWGVDTPEGRNYVKDWLWNHWGDTSYAVGGIAGIGVASACKQDTIAADSLGINSRAGVVGAKYVTRWGDGVDHALTIVGYDDRILFDLNGNGILGEESEDERGAWIIVNSWGNGWANKGFIYCPYKYGFPVRQNEGGAWKPEFYHVRKDYRPLRTLRVTMDYSRRSELLMKVGISADTAATEPEYTVEMEHFKRAGDGRSGKAKMGIEAATPMLGRWADGRLHTEPMEFGYDLTDLSANVDWHRPVRYFFIIERDSTAIGQGRLRQASVIDYQLDHRGIETPIPANLRIERQGRRTMVSAVVTGEPFLAPSALHRTSDGRLVWSAPTATRHTLAGYLLSSQALPEQRPAMPRMPRQMPRDTGNARRHGERRQRPPRQRPQRRNMLPVKTVTDTLDATATVLATPRPDCAYRVAALYRCRTADGRDTLVASTPTEWVAARPDSLYDLRTARADSLWNARYAAEATPAAVGKHAADFTVLQGHARAGERLTLSPLHQDPRATYTWTFKGADRNGAHTALAGATYEEAGTYRTRLTVTTPDGKRHSRTMRLHIAQSVPRAAFTAERRMLYVGQTARLTCTSRYAPTERRWMATSPTDTLQARGRHAEWRITQPGVYDVMLAASNDAGTDTLRQARTLVVCQADSRNGLNFSRPESRLDTDGAPLTADSTATMTLSWWMQTLTDGRCAGMGGADSTWSVSADNAGRLTFSTRRNRARSPRDFVQRTGWHHYAVTFDHGIVTFYRDGEALGADTLRHRTLLPALPAFTMGGKQRPVAAVIDEVSLWNTCLGTADLRRYANAPIADIAAAEREHGLLLYYNFNQNGGDVNDQTSHRRNGRRTDFGPDGDAWGLSEGVFSLPWSTTTEQVR